MDKGKKIGKYLLQGVIVLIIILGTVFCWCSILFPANNDIPCGLVYKKMILHPEKAANREYYMGIMAETGYREVEVDKVTYDAYTVSSYYPYDMEAIAKGYHP